MCNWTTIMSGQGVVERASAELSKRINGLSLRVGKQHRNVGKSSSVMERMTNVFCGNSNTCNIPLNPTIPQGQTLTGGEKLRRPGAKIASQSRKAVYIASRPITWNELLVDEDFLSKFFWYFTAADRSNLARVCTRWKEILYRNSNYWSGLSLCINYKQFSQTTANEKTRLYASFIRRGFLTLGMLGAKDEDVHELITYFPASSKCVHSLVLKWCGISDRGLETLVEHMLVSDIYIAIDENVIVHFFYSISYNFYKAIRGL